MPVGLWGEKTSLTRPTGKKMYVRSRSYSRVMLFGSFFGSVCPFCSPLAGGTTNSTELHFVEQVRFSFKLVHYQMSIFIPPTQYQHNSSALHPHLYLPTTSPTPQLAHMCQLVLLMLLSLLPLQMCILFELLFDPS